MGKQNGDLTIDLTQIWGVGFLRWRIISAIMFASIATWFLWSQLPAEEAPVVQPAPVLPSTYSARSVYSLETVSDGKVAADEVIRLAHALTETYRVALTMPSTLATLIDDTGLALTTEEITRKINVATIPSTQLISVTATDGDPDAAIAMANGFSTALDATIDSSAFGLGEITMRLVAFEPANTTIENKPPLPATATTPDPPRINPFGLFLLGGILISFVTVFFVEWIDQRANWPKQVTANTGFSAIGRLRHRRRQSEPEFMVRRDDATGVESFRMARTRLAATMVKGEKGRSLLVASPGAREGKTIVLANLADAMSEDGATVAVVSSDFRSSSSIDNIWDVSSGQPGLSDFLVDQTVNLEDVTRDTQRHGMDIIPRGNEIERAMPLVHSERMAGLIEQLKAQYDWVLLDSPGTLETADAARLSGLVDGTMVVVDGTRTKLTSVKEAFSVLEDAGARIVGFFHNRHRSDPVAMLFGKRLD